MMRRIIQIQMGRCIIKTNLSFAKNQMEKEPVVDLV